ncbi:MAG TPA: hypothetical protein DEA08_00210 [Planctomycetes bacterium]|nr:hypothetical protein [Planctomycetota bacterium]|tara:strand:+ start:212 stop:508 length:297 start_codon:yes stop_codon:yes gene_type:complete
MAGQLAACVRYDVLPECGYYADKLVRALAELHDPDLADLRRLRGFMDQLFDLLYARQLINSDDRDTYREVFPVFSPFYVAYDVEVTTPLAEQAQRLLA